MPTSSSKRECHGDFIGDLDVTINGDSADLKNQKSIGVCQSNQNPGETHFLVDNIKRDCVKTLSSSPLKVSSRSLQAGITPADLKRTKIRVYDWRCPMHIEGGKDAVILAETHHEFEDVPENLNIAIEIILKQALTQLRAVFERHPENEKLLVDVVAY